jgi:hypothetical protein
MSDRKIKFRIIACSFEISPKEFSHWLDVFLKSRSIDYSGVVVCNGSHYLASDTPVWKYRKGTNINFDFSAYREGIEALEFNDYDLCLFLNDTLITKHAGYSHLSVLFKYAEIMSSWDYPVIAGKTDEYNSICYFNPWSKLPVYVSSFCFLANVPCIKYVIEVNEISEGRNDGYDCLDSNIQEGTINKNNFSLFLDAHLKFLGTGLSWYQLKKHKNSEELIRKKSKCVFMEHRLSGFIGANGSIISIYNTPRLKSLFFFNEQKAKIIRKISSFFLK